jgi:cyanocobalamin reductase (cyanide-eliminating) / alkylcobalamin dealkylase
MTHTEPLTTALHTIATRCTAHGLDLHAAATVGAYNALVDEPFHLPGADDRAVVVVGNTRAMWTHVERFVHRYPHLADPVDAHVMRVVLAAVNGLPVDVIDVRFSHEPPPRRVAIQRLADVAGLAWLAPSHLCVDPEHGPWIALRAAVVLDAVGPASQPASPTCDCSTGCMPALERALAAGEPTNGDELRDHWLLWLAMRDACPLGHAHRYGDEQIRYHYNGVRPPGWPPLDTVGT